MLQLEVVWSGEYDGWVAVDSWGPGLSNLTDAFQAQNFTDRPSVSGVGEGLRERKKRMTRQLISDTATGMFLDRGFDAVRVVEIAAACGVSEKTVYNYFPTKESLILDREEAMTEGVRHALGPEGPAISPIDAMVELIAEDVRRTYSYWDDNDESRFDVTLIRRFAELFDQTPSLRAAQQEMMERLIVVAARAMATRAGVDPDDPEPQIAADALIGLWRIAYLSMRKFSDGERRAPEIRDLVLVNLSRAARLIDSGLWSFGVVVQGSGSRAQIMAATDAANDARKQVVAAIRQARQAWRQVKADAHLHHTEMHRAARRPQRNRH
jgi:AcrR family transcriptional regulator